MSTTHVQFVGDMFSHLALGFKMPPRTQKCGKREIVMNSEPTNKIFVLRCALVRSDLIG